MEIDLDKAREDAYRAAKNGINKVLVRQNYQAIRSLRKEGYGWSAIEQAIRCQVGEDHDAVEGIKAELLRRQFIQTTNMIEAGDLLEGDLAMSKQATEIRQKKDGKQPLFGGYGKFDISQDQEAFVNELRANARKGSK